MPGMDKTGPFGTGPMGRGMGPCGGGLASQRGRGRGMGRGFRHGGGCGGRPTPVVSAEEEKTLLEEQRDWLKTQVEAVEKQLENLNKPEE
ncbi:MAG: DUF5320 domain-containing protein [Thermotogaceae bacterium]|nr:DUF5320 domain-containing protein [Thermotogaceae bacterium]